MKKITGVQITGEVMVMTVEEGVAFPFGVGLLPLRKEESCKHTIMGDIWKVKLGSEGNGRHKFLYKQLS